MKTTTIRVAFLLLACGRMVNAATIEVPPPREHDGISSGPFANGPNVSYRWQQVYSSAAFSSFGQGPGQITSMGYNINASGGTVYSVQVNLSTTTKAVDGLSTTFSQNVGADDMMVLGASTLYWTGNPAGYDGTINFTTPFVYNPAAGNLLVDLRVYRSGTAIGSFEDLHAFATSRPGDWVSSVLTGDVNATAGGTTTLGLDTLFTYTPVPEPKVGLLVLGLCVVIGCGRFQQGRITNRRQYQTRL
jgi:hypothetical protein